MDKVRGAALAISVTAWTAVGMQVVLSVFHPIVGDGGWPALFGLYGYFTIWTNTLAALVMTHIGWRGLDNRLLGRKSTVAALVVYIVVVGAVYHLVLAAQYHPVGINKFVDTLLHTVVPLLVPLFWLALVPHGGLRWGSAFAWLLYPTAYLGVALARGAATGKYAYPFLDLTKLDGATVMRNIVLLFALFALLSLAIIALDRALGRVAQGAKIQPGE